MTQCSRGGVAQRREILGFRVIATKYRLKRTPKKKDSANYGVLFFKM